MSEENSKQLETATESPEKVEVTIDTSKIREEVTETVQKVLEAKELEKSECGKGEVSEEVQVAERHVEIIENMKKGIKEQWTVALPKTTKEAASHLRDYCYESNALEGKPGNTVNYMQNM